MTPASKKKLYYDMLRIRLIEEAIAERYHEQEMRCPVHLCIGQEAIAVGVCANLSKDDYVMSTHRSHAHYLAKGGDLRAMIAEIYGKATLANSFRFRPPVEMTILAVFQSSPRVISP